MPNYDYYCDECKAIWDVSVPLAELDKELKCPDCEKVLIRMISTPAVRVH